MYSHNVKNIESRAKKDNDKPGKLKKLYKKYLHLHNMYMLTLELPCFKVLLSPLSPPSWHLTPTDILRLLIGISVRWGMGAGGSTRGCTNPVKQPRPPESIWKFWMSPIPMHTTNRFESDPYTDVKFLRQCPTWPSKSIFVSVIWKFDYATASLIVHNNGKYMNLRMHAFHIFTQKKKDIYHSHTPHRLSHLPILFCEYFIQWSFKLHFKNYPKNHQ